MADDEKVACKNPVCSCAPQPGGKYCSASCEGAGKTIELDCDCGHPEGNGNFETVAGIFRIEKGALTAPLLFRHHLCQVDPP